MWHNWLVEFAVKREQQESLSCPGTIAEIGCSTRADASHLRPGLG